MLGKTPDEQPQLLAHLLSRLSHTEQIRLIMTHPFFTGRCPSCKQRVQLAKASLGNCRCNACGWSDESLCQGQHSDRLTSE
jgi:Zn finger protein HypA/HybF involved in hydrogenase expression